MAYGMLSVSTSEQLQCHLRAESKQRSLVVRRHNVLPKASSPSSKPEPDHSQTNDMVSKADSVVRASMVRGLHGGSDDGGRFKLGLAEALDKLRMTSLLLADLYFNKLAPSVGPKFNLASAIGHLSALKELLNEPGNHDLIKPLLLNFNDEDEDTDDEVEEVKSIMIDEDWMNVPIVFLLIRAGDFSEEAIMVRTEVEGYLVRRIHVDEGASIEIMYEHCFNMLHLALRYDWSAKKNYQAYPQRQSISHASQSEEKSVLRKKSQVITQEAAEWLKAGIIRLVRYPTWISNPVLAKKVDGSWRMCIDFKNINSACPKDYYPLPAIDRKIGSVMGFSFKCFLDAYKGYHQVQMVEDDEEKMAFYTDQGPFCYTKNVVRPQERQGNIPKIGRRGIQVTNKAKLGSLCG
nr:reverse transcriptase domain-containing protein [Tanacetum cinerariifolium]